MIYDSKHIRTLYRGFINDHMYVDIKCGGATECAEVNPIGLILMLVEDIQRRKKKLSEIEENLREANTNTSDHRSSFRRKGILENTIECDKDMMISILIKCTEEYFPSISTALQKYFDCKSSLEVYKDMEMVAVFGKTKSVIALEEQYLESPPAYEMV